MSTALLPKRVLTYLKVLNSGEIRPAKFGECILGSFSNGSSQGEVRISCELVDDKLILSQSDSNTGAFGLDHAESCPALELNDESRRQLPTEIANRGVNTAVCVILESSDDCVLLTRRSKHMRTFPNVWVPPGGGIEPGESLEETGLRELFEEAGLKLNKTDIVSDRPLCLWESVYPQTLSRGLPTRQHVVLYHHFRVQLDSRQLADRIVLDTQETDAFMWISQDLARLAIMTSSEIESQTEKSLTVYESGLGTVQKPISILTTDLPSTGADVERISSGTKFAIQEWIKMKNSMQIDT